MPLFRWYGSKPVLIKYFVDLEQVGYAVAKAECKHRIFRDDRRKGIASRLQKAVGLPISLYLTFVPVNGA